MFFKPLQALALIVLSVIIFSAYATADEKALLDVPSGLIAEVTVIEEVTWLLIITALGTMTILIWFRSRTNSRGEPVNLPRRETELERTYREGRERYPRRDFSPPSGLPPSTTVRLAYDDNDERRRKDEEESADFNDDYEREEEAKQKQLEEEQEERDREDQEARTVEEFEAEEEEASPGFIDECIEHGINLLHELGDDHEEED